MDNLVFVDKVPKKFPKSVKGRGVQTCFGRYKIKASINLGEDRLLLKGALGRLVCIIISAIF